LQILISIVCSAGDLPLTTHHSSFCAPDTTPEAAAAHVAKELYAKYIAGEAVKLPEDIRAPLVGLFGGDKPPEVVPLDTFRTAQGLVHNQLKNDQFSGFLASPQYAQYCISILSSGTARVEEMLYSEPFRCVVSLLCVCVWGSIVLHSLHCQCPYHELPTTATTTTTVVNSVSALPATTTHRWRVLTHLTNARRWHVLTHLAARR
jgi:hypothetical protein